MEKNKKNDEYFAEIAKKLDALVVQRIHFVRNDERGHASCLIKVYDDGSVSARGDGVFIGFEESDTCTEDAIKYVEARGYVRCPES